MSGTLAPNHTEVTIPAHRDTEGVLPTGSMWSKNPVPAGSWTTKGWQGNEHPPQACTHFGFAVTLKWLLPNTKVLPCRAAV